MGNEKGGNMISPPARSCFAGVSEEEEERAESSNLEDPPEALLGSDNSSADYYFDSYSHFGIHEEMLRDTIRTRTYQSVIYQNKFLFNNKIVLDVGAGTGILSLFCTKAGAKHVYAVECSSMADMAKEIVEANGFSEVITVVKGKVEEITLPVTHVDIIISEWMGYFLLYENMLDTVLYTRDQWLNEYKRGISSWNFDVEDLKAQAALIPDEDIPCKDPEECQNPLSELDTLHESMCAGVSSTCCSLKDENMENLGVMQNKSALPQSPDQLSCSQRSQSNRSDNGPKEASSNDQNNMQNGVQLHVLSGIEVSPLSTKGSVRSVQSSAALNKKKTQSCGGQNSLPWTEKYRPKVPDDIIGNQSLVKQLREWLMHWNEHFLHADKKVKGKKQSDSGANKAVLLSGTPGIGKTTSAKLVNQMLGYQAVEVNASDTRGKTDSKIVKGIGGNKSNAIKVLVNNESLGGKNWSKYPKSVLIMDKVDGMSAGPIDGGIVMPDITSLYLIAIEDGEYKENKIEFWNNVYGFDMSCIKKVPMMEPLVDTVDPNQIVTNCQLLKSMNISKMAPGDTSFTAPFKLVAHRNDYIHALVAYFDVSFTKCHRLMGFSTGPRSKATHWKQTVLYLEDMLTICEGETLVGSMSVEPNKKNPRDVDITLNYSLNGLRCQVSATQHYKMR